MKSKKPQKKPKTETTPPLSSKIEAQKESEQAQKLKDLSQKIDKIAPVIEGINPEDALKQPSVNPDGALEAPCNNPENPASPSGMVKILYLAICDQLCDLTGKERFNQEQKQKLCAELDADLNELDSKYVAPFVGDNPAVRILAKTGCEWFTQPDKPKDKPKEGDPASSSSPPSSEGVIVQ
ncbi:MAG: hypothetical protein V1933_08040 [Candidatus Omnitrophota bacterium]